MYEIRQAEAASSAQAHSQLWFINHRCCCSTSRLASSSPSSSSPPTHLHFKTNFPCHVTKAIAGMRGSEIMATPVTAGKRPTGNPVDRFSGFGGKRLTPSQTPFPPREELPPSGPPARRTTQPDPLRTLRSHESLVCPRAHDTCGHVAQHALFPYAYTS